MKRIMNEFLLEYKNTSKASSLLSLFFLTAIQDIPAPPLNEGSGNGGGYPQ